MAGITVINLRKIDLNLLITLDALLTDPNVTRTAERLHLSQPSVSVHLSKLRHVFNDPLLLPGPRGMRPTAKADELREPLRLALEALTHAIAPAGPFDPLLATHTWRIAASDNSASTLLVPVLASLREAAPHTRLAVIEKAPSRLAKEAEDGHIDLGFHTRDDAPAGLHMQVLYSEHYVLACRIGHPLLQRPPSLAQFCQLEHIVVSPDGGGFTGITDKVLAERGLSRKVVMSAPHFRVVAAALGSTDLVALLPARLAGTQAGLQVMEPPVDIPGYEIAMFWPERLHRDPAHRWLRGFIADSVGESAL